MDDFEKELNLLKERSCFRQIQKFDTKDIKYIFADGYRYLNLSSNDYLSLSNDKNLVDEFLNNFAENENMIFSSTSARLLTGQNNICSELEEYLATAYNKERCLLFNNGYQANLGVISALNKKGCAVFSDKLNHASIIDGMKLADGDFYRYKHLNYEHLEKLLQKHKDNYEQLIIVSESVFSMDGDIADVKKLIEIKQKYNALLIIDEAHAFGVFGENGFGIAEGIKEIDLIVATFGKAIASYGAFVVGQNDVIDYLINKARSFIFSTMIPPVNVLWTKWILKEKLSNFKQERKNLLTLADKLRSELVKKGLQTLGESQIVPVIIGDDEETVKLAEYLKSKGYWAAPIRPPTVPKASSRLRLSLTASMNWDDVKELPNLICEALV